MHCERFHLLAALAAIAIGLCQMRAQIYALSFFDISYPGK
jgi:hypothetical protein